jgi:acyl-CoA synthetase (AMP-forming)/AMP-acid ligase II
MHIDPAHGSSQVSRILKAWPPAAIVASRPILMLGMLFPELRRIPKRFVVGGRAHGATTLCTAEAPHTSQAVIKRSAADSAILSFTSGSTGEPKALIRTHGFLLKQLEILKEVANVQPEDIDYVAMPMFVLFNLANRITSVLPACNMKHPGRADPRIVLSQLIADASSPRRLCSNDWPIIAWFTNRRFPTCAAFQRAEDRWGQPCRCGCAP